MTASQPQKIDRREYLQYAACTLAAPAGARCLGSTADVSPKSVAAVITAYSKGLHADVLIGKILEGWKQDGGSGPALKLASMYVEQFPANDMARSMSAKYNVPIFDSIEGALTLGGTSLPVDGVISIGEHGSYPYNEKGQHLYPRKRFFQGIVETFKKYNKVVPVFNDKHLGPEWPDAQWMYQQAQLLKIPWMSGSSLPVSFREPDITISPNSSIEAAVGIGYSGLDIYGSHTLDCYQCLVEKRLHTERGVAWVQCLEGDAVWDRVDSGLVSQDLLDAALAVTPTPSGVGVRESNPTLFLFRYRDGFLGSVFMLPGYAGAISAAVKLANQPQPLATRFVERAQPSHPHFAYLLKAIEQMMHTGQPSYPVERVLLTSGILDRALTSRVQGHRHINTPELAIPYQPVLYPHAPMPALESQDF